jgi:hypothetical protein
VLWHGTHARLTVHRATAGALLHTPRRPCLQGAGGVWPLHTCVRERTGCSWRLYASTFYARRKLAQRLHRMLFTQQAFADRGGRGSRRGGVRRSGALTTCWPSDTTSSQWLAREASVAGSTAVHGETHGCPSLAVSQEPRMHQPLHQAWAGPRGGRRVRLPLSICGIWFAHPLGSTGVGPLA